MKLKQSSKGKVRLFKPKRGFEIEPVRDGKSCKERWLEVYENLGMDEIRQKWEEENKNNTRRRYAGEEAIRQIGDCPDKNELHKIPEEVWCKLIEFWNFIPERGYDFFVNQEPIAHDDEPLWDTQYWSDGMLHQDIDTVDDNGRFFSLSIIKHRYSVYPPDYAPCEAHLRIYVGILEWICQDGVINSDEILAVHGVSRGFFKISFQERRCKGNRDDEESQAQYEKIVGIINGILND